MLEPELDSDGPDEDEPEEVLLLLEEEPVVVAVDSVLPLEPEVEPNGNELLECYAWLERKTGRDLLWDEVGGVELENEAEVVEAPAEVTENWAD